jgi:hypothetical protein
VLAPFAACDCVRCAQAQNSQYAQLLFIRGISYILPQCDIVVTGDPIQDGDQAIVIANHQASWENGSLSLFAFMPEICASTMCVASPQDMYAALCCFTIGMHGFDLDVFCQRSNDRVVCVPFLMHWYIGGDLQKCLLAYLTCTAASYFHVEAQTANCLSNSQAVLLRVCTNCQRNHRLTLTGGTHGAC